MTGTVWAAARDRDRGAGTVLVLGLVAVALMVTVFAVALGRAAQARGTAQAGADMAAIAAAEAAQRAGRLDVAGAQQSPCAVADQVARANGAQVTSCAVASGGFVEIATRVEVTLLAGWRGAAEATSRAGPL